MKRFEVRFTPEAETDLLRLFEFVAATDLSSAERAYQAIVKAIDVLEVFPFSCRKAPGGSGSAMVRELIIPFGDAGYVALFEIEPVSMVTVLAIRHQREHDFT